MSSNATVIPAFPYEGALLWFLTEGRRHSQSHPYYRVLYGPDPEALRIRSAALTCLFSKIEMAPADVLPPDYNKYDKGKNYFHPDLRLSIHRNFSEWEEKYNPIVKLLFEDKFIRMSLEGHPHFRGDHRAQEHFLHRLVAQADIAGKTGAVVIGDEFFHKIYSPVARFILRFLDHKSEPSNATSVVLESDDLHILGLDFAPSNLEEFAAVRTSREITEYADGVWDAIVSSNNAKDRKSALIKAMSSAMEKEEVALKAAAALNITGSVMNGIGFIPGIGTVASAVGIGADAGEKLAERRAKDNRWYLIGSKVQEVIKRNQLREYLKNESNSIICE